MNALPDATNSNHNFLITAILVDNDNQQLFTLKWPQYIHWLF